MSTAATISRKITTTHSAALALPSSGWPWRSQRHSASSPDDAARSRQSYSAICTCGAVDDPARHCVELPTTLVHLVMAYFKAVQFVATRFDSAEAKAKAANALASFVEGGFEARRFTKAVYNALYLHLFGHIAHF